MKTNRTEILLTIVAIIYNIGILIVSILWLFTNQFADWKAGLSHLKSLQINENITYGLFLAGGLGGAFYCLRALYQRMGNAFTPIQPNDNPKSLNMKVWIFWYLYRPIQGGVLALILLALTKGNLMKLESDDFDFNSYYSLVALGFLSGFGAHELIHKIQELIQVLFAKSNQKSSNSEQKVKENNGER